MNNETESKTTSTTFNTWGRVAEDHMQRMSEVFANGSKVQRATLEQGKEFVTYNLKLAGEWQAWVAESSRKFAGQFLGAK